MIATVGHLKFISKFKRIKVSHEILLIYYYINDFLARISSNNPKSVSQWINNNIWIPRYSHMILNHTNTISDEIAYTSCYSFAKNHEQTILQIISPHLDNINIAVVEILGYANKLANISSEIRDICFGNVIESLVSNFFGAEALPEFLYYCFIV